MNRFELFNAMVNRKEVTLRGVTGKIVQIELEDGSGHNFIVTLNHLDKGVNKVVELFIRG